MSEHLHLIGPCEKEITKKSFLHGTRLATLAKKIAIMLSIIVNNIQNNNNSKKQLFDSHLLCK
jgi:hypothetical protein